MEVLGADELSLVFRLLNTQELLVCSTVNKTFRETAQETVTQLCGEKKFPTTTSVRDYALLFGYQGAAFGDHFHDYTNLARGKTQEQFVEGLMSGDWCAKAVLLSNLLVVLRNLYQEGGEEEVMKMITDSGLLSYCANFTDASLDPIIASVISNYKLMFVELLEEITCGPDAENGEILTDLILYLAKTEFTVVWSKIPLLFRQSFEQYRFYFLHTEESITEGLAVAQEATELHALLSACCRCSLLSEELFVKVVAAYAASLRVWLDNYTEGTQVALRRRRQGQAPTTPTVPTNLKLSNESFACLLQNLRHDLLRHVAQYIDRAALATKAEQYVLDLFLKKRATRFLPTLPSPSSDRPEAN